MRPADRDRVVTSKGGVGDVTLAVFAAGTPGGEVLSAKVALGEMRDSIL